MKRRGSAMIFVVAMLAAMTAALLATVGLTSGALRAERRWEDLVRMRYALDAVKEQAAADYTKGTLTAFPTNRTATVNGVSCIITIDEYDPIPHMMQVTVAMTLRGRTVTESQLVGMRKSPSPFVYAIFANNGVTFPGTLVTGANAWNGDIYCRGNIALTGVNNAIHGDLESTGTISIVAGTVHGVNNPSASQIPFPSIAAANYSSIADATITKNSISGYTFPATADQYYVAYRSGNLSINGSMRGKGTIFVDGAVTFTGATSYYDSASSVAIIASGNITFGPTCSQVVGYLFTPGTLTTPSVAVVLQRGAIVSNALVVGGPLSVSNDVALWQNDDEGRKHRLPGYYP